MTVTEEQAKEKWCPMTHRDNHVPHSKCIGSKCMMWVWEHKPTGHCGLTRS